MLKMTAALTHLQNHPEDKHAVRRLTKLYNKHKGACARLAAQKNILAPHSPRQDNFFSGALLENWSYLLLSNPELIKSIGEPAVPVPYKQLNKIINQISAYNQDAAGSAEETENIFNAQEKKIFINSAASLGLKSRENINFAFFFDCNKEYQDDPFSADSVLNITRFSKIRCRKFINPECAAQICELLKYNSHPLRIVLKPESALSVCRQLNEQHIVLPQNSIIFIWYKDIMPQNQGCDILKNKISELFKSDYKIRYIWTNSLLRSALISCSEGCFHLPVSVRITEDNLWCSPCSRRISAFAQKFTGRLNRAFICSCGLKSPIVQ